MSKIANGNVVYSGWLVKSPPESKFRLSGPWKIFRSKWKRRFFVLFKPQGSLPHQYVLNYYNNEEGKKLKGYIDLEHCEQIIESLDLDLFPFLLAIKTFHKTRERTYFLAADTEDQMATWVRNLCSVCGLKPEDNSPDLPPQREDESDTFTTIETVPSTVTKQPLNQQPSRNVSQHIPQTKTDSVEEYLPLSTCTTGTKSNLLRPDSIDSVPDEVAPSPPVKKGMINEGDNDVFHSSVYDMPPKSHNGMSRTIPAPRITTCSKDDSMLEVYDVPPPGHPPRHSPSTPRSSSSESHKADSAYSSQSGLTYDYPPTSERGQICDETYDYPPTNPANQPKMDDVPPVRPPPPKSHQQQEPYQNIPPNSKILNEDMNSLDINKVVPMSQLTATMPMSYDFPSNNASTIMYDLPKQSGVPSNLLVIPPPGSCSNDSHSYINAATSRVSNVEEDMYLPMGGVNDRTSSVSETPSHESYTTMSEVSVYDHPPPQRPPRISKPVPKPCNGDTYIIYKNERTRSFKKNDIINHPSNEFSGRDPFGKVQKHNIALPINQHPDLTTSSEDEDDERIADIDQSWERVPPPMMTDSKDPELKYLELDLVDQPKSQSIHIAHPEPGMSTPTEYREIDFVKTKALSEVKKTVEGQRKHDET